MTVRSLDLLTRSWAVALVVGLPAVGVAAGLRQAVTATLLYRSGVMLAIEAEVHSAAQAGVIAAGTDLLVKQMLADGSLARDLGSLGGLTLEVQAVGADQIHLTGESPDAGVVRSAIDLAARRVVTISDEERRALTRGTSADQPSIDSPDMVWARSMLDAYLAKRPTPLAAQQARRESDEESDEMIRAILDRGVEAGKRRSAIEGQMALLTRSSLAAVTEPWFTYPLRVVGAASELQAIRPGSPLRLSVGGALIGLGVSLLLVVTVASIARARGLRASRA